MDEEKLFAAIRKLCMKTGEAIDMIAKKCGVNQNLVAKLYLETMKSILDKMEG